VQQVTALAAGQLFLQGQAQHIAIQQPGPLQPEIGDPLPQLAGDLLQFLQAERGQRLLRVDAFRLAGQRLERRQIAVSVGGVDAGHQIVAGGALRRVGRQIGMVAAGQQAVELLDVHPRRVGRGLLLPGNLPCRLRGDVPRLPELLLDGHVPFRRLPEVLQRPASAQRMLAPDVALALQLGDGRAGCLQALLHRADDALVAPLEGADLAAQIHDLGLKLGQDGLLLLDFRLQAGDLVGVVVHRRSGYPRQDAGREANGPAGGQPFQRGRRMASSSRASSTLLI